MTLRQGMAHIRESAERAKAQRSQNQQGSFNWFWWQDGESKILRFLTDADQVYVVFVHERVECPDGKMRPFICRKEFDADCELCNKNVYRREMGYGVAVLREEVLDEKDGKRQIVGYQDTTEVVDDENGQKKIRPWIGIVNQAPGNFWTYIDAVYEKFGSLKAFDVEVKRQGGDAKTIYIPFQCPPVEIPNIDERYKNYVPDLKGFLENLGSQAYYDRHLRGTGGNQTSQNQSPAAGNVPPETQTQSNGVGTGGLDEKTEFDRLREQQASLQGSASGGAYQ